MEPIVCAAQKPLKATYKANPTLARVMDPARTCGDSPADPFRSAASNLKCNTQQRKVCT
jgi:hypothetical protein